MTAAKTQGRETVSPFAWSELRRDLLPIALFGAATLFIAFAETGEAFDRHWTTAWLLTGLATVGLTGAKLIRLTHPMLWSAGMLVLLMQGFRGGCERWEVLALWGWLWTSMWTLPVDRGRFWQGAKALPLVALLIGGLMLLHAVKQMWNGQWDHGASYAMSLPWAHRNIAMEALFAMEVDGGVREELLDEEDEASDQRVDDGVLRGSSKVWAQSRPNRSGRGRPPEQPESPEKKAGHEDGRTGVGRDVCSG